MNKVTKYTDEEIRNILKDAKSFSDVVKSFGYKSATTGSYVVVKNELRRRKIEIPEYNYFSDFNNFGRERSVEELFTENSGIARISIKRRILKDNLIPYVCDKCGNEGKWQDEELVLQLEHKNGINDDHRLENNHCFLFLY